MSSCYTMGRHKMLINLFSMIILIFGAPGVIQCHKICNFTMLMIQQLQNNGFHRNLTYSVLFQNPTVDKSKKQYVYDGCVLSVFQELPAGVFVNPDELNDLRRSKKLNAFPNTGVNIEVATEHAQPCNVYIFTPVLHNKAKTWLPVHARYHKAVEGGGFAENVLDPPKAFLRCSDARLKNCDLPLKTKTYLCAKDPDKCTWKEIVPKMVTEVIVWPVPVGNLDYYNMTSIITLVVVIGGSILLMIGIHNHKVAYRNRKIHCD